MTFRDDYSLFCAENGNIGDDKSDNGNQRVDYAIGSDAVETACEGGEHWHEQTCERRSH